MKKILSISLISFFALSCNQTPKQNMENKLPEQKSKPTRYYSNNNREFDAQGHRGGRGLWPENSIYGFINAVDTKVTTLEMDVVVSKDNYVVVSHDPFFNPDICIDASGNKLDENILISIHQLPYSQVKQFDCGTLPYTRFPEQEKIKTVKPLLSEVIKVVESKTKKENLVPLNYNIEIKSRPEWENKFQPANPDKYVKLVLDTIRPLLPYDRFTIQSFDVRILEAIAKYDPNVRLVYLIEDVKLSPDIADNLSFTPEVISPDFTLLSPELIEIYHQKGFKVIPWTVDETSDMEQLMDWGVDGLISDYPDRLVRVCSK